MSLGISIPKSWSSTYVAPAPAPTTASIVRTITPKPTVIPYYDPSRIFKDIRVVTDLRQQGTERGEIQAGDNGMLGPGLKARVPVSTEKNNLIPIAIAIAAFILLGG